MLNVLDGRSSGLPRWTNRLIGLDSQRDRHLFGKGPKRLLALDGGGVRGAITVAFLERIERLICDEQAAVAASASADGHPKPPGKVRLGD